jgi:CHAT domain-containing protein/tetratricopeptide (TPR) repeat protein
MEGISGGNKSGSLKTCFLNFFRLSILTVLLNSHAYSQCNLNASEWLDKLAQIETMDLVISVRINHLSSLKEAYEKCDLKKDSVYARMIHRLGDLHRINGDFEKGIRLTAEAVRINKQNQPGFQRSYLTHSYYNLGLYNNLLGLIGDAHLYYDSCVEVGLQYPEKVFIALMALEKKAFMYFQTGDYEQSIGTAERGIMQARKQNLPDYEALLLIQKAQSESELNRVTEADRDVSKAISILNDNKLEAYLPNAYSVYANVLSRRKKFVEAITYYNKSFDLNVAQQNSEQSARDLHDLGLLYDKELNDPKRSIAHYIRAIKVLETLQDPYMLSATYNNLGQVCWRKNDFKTALEYYQKGLMVLPLRFYDADIRNNPGLMQLRAATNEYIPAALLWNKGDAWLGLYNLEKNIVFLRYALASYKDGDRMVDQMRWKQQGEQSKLFWREKTKRWYEKAVEASFLLNDPDEAFYFMEKSRAVLLNDKLAELGAKNKLPPEEAETERSLRIKLSSIIGKATGNAEEIFNEDLRNAQLALNSFIQQLEKRYPSYYAYKYDTTVYSLSDLQKNLKQGEEAWIELFSNDNSIFALTTTSDYATLHRINFKGHKSTARNITELVSSKTSINRNFRQYRELSYLYYKEVFKPLNISARRVTISQDEYFLPFELLQTDTSNQTRFLLKDHAFSYAYSAAHVLRTKTKSEPAAKSLMAIAPVNYNSHLRLQDLPGADQSLEKIRSFYRDGVFLTKDEATKSRFIDQISGFRVIHLYSHAKADSLGQEPAIYFYDSALNLSELQNLPDLKTRLIVLFACNTGVGKAVKGEGIFSLARGFASAGIPSTVSALWEIDNKATYSLAELFFKNMATGQPSDVALQQAKLEMTNSDNKEYALPYFWAGTVLIGKAELYPSGNARSFSENYEYLLWGIFIVALTAVIFIVSKRGIESNS